MTDEQTELLEKVLVAQVLVLSHLLDQKARERGTQRVGGDFTREAAREIARQQPAVLALLRSAGP